MNFTDYQTKSRKTAKYPPIYNAPGGVPAADFI
jgi:hypothetical protein